MDQFAGILFHMNTGYANPFVLAVNVNIHMASKADRQLELADLIPLWQVGIEVVLSGKDVRGANAAVGGKPRHDGKLYNLTIQYR